MECARPALMQFPVTGGLADQEKHTGGEGGAINNGKRQGHLKQEEGAGSLGRRPSVSVLTNLRKHDVGKRKSQSTGGAMGVLHERGKMAVERN